jgi:hypothetical protein
MKTLNEAIKDLEEIVVNNLNTHVVPAQEKNSVRIGNVIVRPSKKHGFIIIDTEKNASVVTTYSKSGALAAAIAYRKKNSLDQIIYFDRVIEKNSNDCEFYSHVIDKTEVDAKKEIYKTRQEIAESQINWAHEFLNDYIMKDIR